MFHNQYKEFQNTGLMLFINQFLHIFGWALVFISDESGQIVAIRPHRVVFRGFEPEKVESAYRAISSYMVDNAKELLNEVNAE